MSYALDWSNPSTIGYPVIFFGVLLGSIIPIVPTGAVVGAGAAVAMTSAGGLSIPLVLMISTAGAYIGDVITYSIARLGGDPAVRWLARHQHQDRVTSVRDQFARRGWQIVVVGRLLPAGRIPVLLAAGALAYPWRRFLPTALIAATVWAVAYALLGIISGGIFDSPLVASLIATLLVLLVTVAMAVLARRQHRAPDAGRLLRGGRVTLRAILIWVILTAAIRLLDVWLPGFEMTQWWQPTVCALVVSLMSVVVWPLVLRFALPVAFFTLGLGSFLIIGAGTLAIFKAIPGVEIANLRSAVAVTIGMAAVGVITSSLLALDEDEIFFRRVARKGTPSALPPDTPAGVIFLQIDGLGYDTVRRAVRDGDMPTLASWINSDSHALDMWHTDWSSQTGASVCGILHGDNHDILGFRWYEKDRDHVMACAHPRDAAEIERRHSDGKGLLSGGGASHGNLFTGDADHVSLTMSAVPVLPKGVRRGHNAHTADGYFAYFARPANVIRTFGTALVDMVRELWASTLQRRMDVRPRIKRGGIYPLARPGTTVITRDVVVSAIIEDILAGRPVVYADFLGYDEVAHHSGIERFDALAVLRGIDQQIGRLRRATRLGPRPYHLVVLSDHGQTQGWAFANRFAEPIESFIGQLCGGSPSSAPVKSPGTAEGWQMGAALAEGGLIARRLRGRVERAEVHEDRHRAPSGQPGEVARVAPGVVVVVSGHIAMVSFTEHEGRVPLETIEREYPELLPTLVDHAGVGFMLVRSTEFGPVVLGRDGLHRLATGVIIGEDPLKDYGPHAADLVRRVDTFPHCADIMINSRYDPCADNASPFEMHVGSHGALGGPQARGFLVYPKSLRPPGEIIGAEALHQLFRGWLTDLGHPEPATPEPEEDDRTLTPQRS